MLDNKIVLFSDNLHVITYSDQGSVAITIIDVGDGHSLLLSIRYCLILFNMF